MKNFILASLVYFALPLPGHSQTFAKYNFKFNGKCALEYAGNTTDGSGNTVYSFQCMTQSGTVTIYRVNVIPYKKAITDRKTYFESLKSEYSKLGQTSNTTLNGQTAIQTIEDIDIQGHSMKQISVSTLYKNKSITLVIVTNSDNYLSLISAAKKQFLFL